MIGELKLAWSHKEIIQIICIYIIYKTMIFLLTGTWTFFLFLSFSFYPRTLFFLFVSSTLFFSFYLSSTQTYIIYIRLRFIQAHPYPSCLLISFYPSHFYFSLALSLSRAHTHTLNRWVAGWLADGWLPSWMDSLSNKEWKFFEKKEKKNVHIGKWKIPVF